MAKKSPRRSGSGVTIHDVARHAGVSPMTVSRVINSESNVRDQTREKVNVSIRTLRYSPNLAARNLASAETVLIGILYANSTAAYLSELLLGALEQASLSGCQLVLEQCEDVESEKKAIQRLTATGGIDGIILPAPLCDSQEALKAVSDAGIPAVLVTSGPPSARLFRRLHQRFRGGAGNDAPSHRARPQAHRLHQRPSGHTASGQRFRGYIEGLTEAGLAVGPDQVAQGFFTYRSGLEAAERLLGNGWNPTAIFASNDDMAAGHHRGRPSPGPGCPARHRGGGVRRYSACHHDMARTDHGAPPHFRHGAPGGAAADRTDPRQARRHRAPHGA